MSPGGKLFGERTFGAVAEIFETEVLVYLKQGLVLPGEFEMGFSEGERTKESFTAAFNFLIGGLGADLGVGIPIVDVEGIESIDEELSEAGFADEFDGVFGLGRFESVVAIPEWAVALAESSGEFFEGRILFCESAE